jgi:enamine deaminase RidA (YjgF/YER057c/UK114 family)
MPIQLVNPPGLAGSPSYSHVTIASAGRTAYVSGQIALDASGNVVGKGDYRAQTRQAFENLRLALAGVGATFDDVTKIVTYVVNLGPDNLGAVREVRSGFFTTAHRPASTLVGVTALAGPDFLVEVEAIALLKA